MTTPDPQPARDLRDLATQLLLWREQGVRPGPEMLPAVAEGLVRITERLETQS